MPPRMITRSADRPVTASRGGGTGGRASRCDGRTRGCFGDQGDGRIDGQGGQVGGQGSEVNDGVNGVPDFSTIIAQQLQNLLPTIVAQVGDQGRGQGNGRYQNSDAVNDNIRGDVSRGCTYKEFLACNPKEYDGKGGVIVYTRWIEKMESVQDMSGCRDSQKVKYTVGSFFGKALTWWNSQIHTRDRDMVGEGHVAYTDRFHKLARLVPHLVTPECKRIERYMYGIAPQIQGMVAATEPKTIQKVVQIAGTLTDEALRNGSIKKNLENRGNKGEPSKDRNVRDGNKRTRTGNAYATTIDSVVSRRSLLNNAKALSESRPHVVRDRVYTRHDVLQHAFNTDDSNKRARYGRCDLVSLISSQVPSGKENEDVYRGVRSKE
ncbi:hypothetical protein Tco_0000843 [Tanacetum coccineum]